MQGPRSSILLLQFLAVVALSGSLGAAHSADIQANGELHVLAQRLQSKLPKLATDQLMEARRTKQGWEYRIRVAESKTWMDELEIQLNAAESYTQGVRIRLVRKEGKLLGDASEREQAIPPRWIQDVVTILND